MTKEELEKEAEEYAYKNKIYIDFDNDFTDYGNVKEAYLAGAEPREKRIAELEDKLANADYQLEGRDIEIAKLEKQIEKMRNCANCKNYNSNEGFCVLGSGYGYNCNLEKWEIKEK